MEKQLCQTVPLECVFDHFSPSSSLEMNVFVYRMQELLQKMLGEVPATPAEPNFYSVFEQAIPIIKYQLDDSIPGCLKFSVLCNGQSEIEINDFLQHFLRYGLIPGKSLPIVSFDSLQFHFNAVKDKKLYLANIILPIKTQHDLDTLYNSLPKTIETIKKGISNPHHLKLLLENQTSFHRLNHLTVYQAINQVSGKFPLHKEKLLSEMHLFLATTTHTFKQGRSSRHLTRTICSFTWINDSLKELDRLSAQNHTALFRLIPTSLKFMFGNKPVIGMCIGISRLNDYEIFTSTHIMRAVKSAIPRLHIVDNSFVHYRNPHDGNLYYYIEVEKATPDCFTAQEIKELRSGLERYLPTSIEDVVPSLFTRRNEEEIMKNVLTLSQEISTPDTELTHQNFNS